jgi:hypothetical protein
MESMAPGAFGQARVHPSNLAALAAGAAAAGGGGAAAVVGGDGRSFSEIMAGYKAAAQVPRDASSTIRFITVVGC